MKTSIIAIIAAMGCSVLAQAQEGSVPSVTDPAVAQVQSAVTPSKSAYHDCLLSAGPQTFGALGLDEGQVVRISELQNRYKNDLKAAEEAKAANDKKSKSTKKVAVKEPVAKDAAQPVAAVIAPMDKTGVVNEQAVEHSSTEQPDPLVMNTDEPLQSPVLAPETTIQTPILEAPSDPAAGDELRGILTAQQWTMWHKQCYHELEETGMIQP